MRARPFTASATLVLGALAATTSLGCENTANDCTKLGISCSSGGGGAGTTTTTTDTGSTGGGGMGGGGMGGGGMGGGGMGGGGMGGGGMGGGGMGGTGGTTTTSTPTVAPCLQKKVVQYGGAENQSAFHVHVKSSNDIAIAGGFFGDLEFGMVELSAADPGPSIFVARAGATLSANVATKLDGEYLASALHPSGGLVVVGWHAAAVNLGCSAPLEVEQPFSTGLFLVRLDPLGMCVFQKSFGADQVDHASVAVASSGEIAIAGGFVGAIQLEPAASGLPESSAGQRDVFVVKLGADGTHLWSDSYGDVNDDEARAVAIHTDPVNADVTRVIVAGEHDGDLNFNDGSGALASGGVPAGFLVAFDTVGAVQWARSFQLASGMQQVYDLAVDVSDAAAPAVVIAGDLQQGDVTALVPAITGDVPVSLKGDDHALFVARFALYGGAGVNAGVHLASKVFPGSGGIEIGGVAVDAAGRVLVGGWLDTALDFDDASAAGDLAADGAPRAFAAVLGPDLKHRRSVAFGGTGAESRAFSVAFDGEEPLLAGHFAGQMTVGGQPFTSAGGTDIFVARLDCAE